VDSRRKDSVSDILTIIWRRGMMEMRYVVGRRKNRNVRLGVEMQTAAELGSKTSKQTRGMQSTFRLVD
jgi:hypothetical protein